MNYYLRPSYELVTWFGQHATSRGYVVHAYVFQRFVCLCVCVFVARTCTYVHHFQVLIYLASRCGGVVDFKIELGAYWFKIERQQWFIYSALACSSNKIAIMSHEHPFGADLKVWCGVFPGMECLDESV